MTAHIGKYLNGYGSELPADVPPGWTEWYGAVDRSTYQMWGYTLTRTASSTPTGRRSNKTPGSTRRTSSGGGR